MSDHVHEDLTPLSATSPKESPHDAAPTPSALVLASREYGGSVLARMGDDDRADVVLALQRTVGNLAVSRVFQPRGGSAAGRILARTAFATVEEAILDEIVHAKRPDRLRELFDSVPAARARSLADVRLREGTRDVLGVRFNSDLPADLRAELLALLRRKYASTPPSTEPQSGELPPSTEPVEMDYDPATGSWVTVHTATDPNYVDTRVTAVGRFLGGPTNDYLMFVDNVDVGPEMSPPQLIEALRGKKEPVRLEPWRIESSRIKSTPIQQAPFADRNAALAGVARASSAHTDVAYHGYHKAVHDMVAPTIFSPATTPRIAAMIQGVEQQRSAAAAAAMDTFTLLAIGIAAQLVAEVLTGIGLLIANRRSGSTRGSGTRTAGGQAESEAENRGAPSVTVATTRPRMRAPDLARLKGESREWLVWRGRDLDVVQNQPIKPTGATNPMVTEDVCFFEGLEGADYGPYFMAVKKADVPSARLVQAPEWRLRGEVPANKGVWYTKDDFYAAFPERKPK